MKVNVNGNQIEGTTTELRELLGIASDPCECNHEDDFFEKRSSHRLGYDLEFEEVLPDYFGEEKASKRRRRGSKKKKRHTQRSEKIWNKKEKETLKKQWKTRTNSNLNMRTRKLINKKIAKTLGRTVHACRICYNRHIKTNQKSKEKNTAWYNRSRKDCEICHKKLTRNQKVTCGSKKCFKKHTQKYYKNYYKKNPDKYPTLKKKAR